MTVPPPTLAARWLEVAADIDAPFIHYFGKTLGYHECEHAIRALAAYLRDRGVRTGDRVVLSLQNVPDFIIGTLAAWRIGAIAMPVNPMYRTRELEHLFADASPAAILCHPEQVEEVAAAMAIAAPDATLLLSDPRAFGAADPRVLPAPTRNTGAGMSLSNVYASARITSLPEPLACDRNATALLLYTSGTTGRPKGAELTHANLAHSADAAIRGFPLRAHSRVHALAPLFHITGFTLHFAVALATRGEIVLHYRFQPAVALEAVRRHRPTFTIAPITAYFALEASPDATPDHFASFDLLATGGAPAPAAAVARFRTRFGRDLRNGYGMTELAGASHLPTRDQAAPMDPASGALSVGRPLTGLDAMIVNDDGEQVPSGTAGELLLRGPQVMRGYWRNPAATQAALKDGWLRTGDIAIVNDDGWFFIVDRKRDMIVASGFKVWPREVEDALYAHPAVQEAAVIGVPDAYRGETVKAVVVLKPGASVDGDMLIAHCRQHLAAYKVPRLCEIAHDLPKTLTGKIIRAQLREAAP